MKEELKEMIEDFRTKAVESGMIQVFKLYCNRFGFRVALKGLNAFLEELNDVLEEEMNKARL